MTRLIDANALKNRLLTQHDRIENGKYEFGSLIKETIMECVSEIESAPTVEIISEEKN